MSQFLGKIGGSAIGIRSLRQSQHCRGIKILDKNDYFEAATTTLGGTLASAILPPLAIVYVTGLVLEELDRKDRKD